MTASANAKADDTAGDRVSAERSARAEALSELLDGELGGSWTPAFSEDCVAIWRGYCLTGSVLRGEVGGAGVDTVDLAARIRQQIDTDTGLRAEFDAGGALSADRRGAWRRRGGSASNGRSTWARWQRAARAKPRFGSAAAFGAAAISVAIGAWAVNAGGDAVSRPDSVTVAGVGAPTFAADAAEVTTPRAGVNAAAAPAEVALAPARSAIPRVETGDVIASHGQLPYFFAHASATSAAYHPGSMNLMPIAATELAGGQTAAVRH